MERCIIIMGVSGCGKTSIGQLLAQRLDYTFVDGDDLHPVANIRKMQQGRPLNDQDREGWFERIIEGVNDLLKSTGVVLACSALKQSYRQRLRAGIDSLAFIYLKGDYERIHRQLQGRKDHFMPVALLKSQLETLQAPSPAETDIYTVEIQPGVEATLGVVTKLLLL